MAWSWGGAALSGAAMAGVIQGGLRVVNGRLSEPAGFVVGSLWVVVEECARQFTDNFYAALGESSDPAAAFGTAVRALKKQREAMPTAAGLRLPPGHPIYWAPFIAMPGAS